MTSPGATVDRTGGLTGTGLCCEHRRAPRRKDELLSEAAAPSDQASRPDADVPPPEQTGHAWKRLTDQLNWYGRKSTQYRNWFHRLKVLQIVIAAAIPVVAGGGAGAWVTGTLGASIVVLEGVQQLFQLQQNWLGYRATAEALKHEKFLYLSHAGPYRDAPAPQTLLAERIEDLVTREHAAWSSAQSEATRA